MRERGLEAGLRVRRTELINGIVSVRNGRKLVSAWLLLARRTIFGWASGSVGPHGPASESCKQQLFLDDFLPQLG